MSFGHIKLSQKEKDQLITLKRNTGIKNWNVLCRWAFCFSLQEKSVPPDHNLPSDSNVEMDWNTFGGAHQEVYLALLKERCVQDNIDLDDASVFNHFRLHLRRGIGYMVGDKSLHSIDRLIASAINEK